MEVKTDDPNPWISKKNGNVEGENAVSPVSGENDVFATLTCWVIPLGAVVKLSALTRVCRSGATEQKLWHLELKKNTWNVTSKQGNLDCGRGRTASERWQPGPFSGLISSSENLAYRVLFLFFLNQGRYPAVISAGLRQRQELGVCSSDRRWWGTMSGEPGLLWPDQYFIPHPQKCRHCL